MPKIKDNELISIAQTYNDQGRQVAYELIKSHGINYPYAVLKRMKNHPKFTYDKGTDAFIYQEKSQSDDVFMSIEDLCSSVHTEPISRCDDRSIAMEKLIQDLLGDRLLELSKYITIESASKTMMIDQTSLKNAGYKVISY